MHSRCKNPWSFGPAEGTKESVDLWSEHCRITHGESTAYHSFQAREHKRDVHTRKLNNRRAKRRQEEREEEKERSKRARQNFPVYKQSVFNDLGLAASDQLNDKQTEQPTGEVGEDDSNVMDREGES